MPSRTSRMEDQVAEPAADDRAGHDPDGDEGDVVRAQAAGTREDAGQDEGRDDRRRERDRLPADDQVAEQLDEGSKSNVMTAIGTVAMSVSKVDGRAPRRAHSSRAATPREAMSAGRQVACPPGARRYAVTPTSSAQSVVERGGVRSAMKRQASLGALPTATSASGPRGNGPDVATPMGGGRRWQPSDQAPNIRLQVDLLGRLDARTADDRTSASRVAMPRRCSRCSSWPAGRARARRSPPTCGPMPTPLGRIAAPGAVAGPPGLVRGGRPARRCSTSTPRPSASGSMPGSTSTSPRSRPAWSDDACAPSGHRAVPRRPARRPRPRLLRRRARAPADRYEDALALVAERRLAAGDLVGARARGAAPRTRPPARGGPRGPHRRPRPDRVALTGRPPVPAAHDVLAASSARRRCRRPRRSTGRRSRTRCGARTNGRRSSTRNGNRSWWPSAADEALGGVVVDGNGIGFSASGCSVSMAGATGPCVEGSGIGLSASGWSVSIAGATGAVGRSGTTEGEDDPSSGRRPARGNDTQRSSPRSATGSPCAHSVPRGRETGSRESWTQDMPKPPAVPGASSSCRDRRGPGVGPVGARAPAPRARSRSCCPSRRA